MLGGYLKSVTSTPKQMETNTTVEQPAEQVPPTPEQQTTETKPEEPQAEEIVELTLTAPRLVQYVVAEIGGKVRWLDREKMVGFDAQTGVVRMTKAQAIAWKLA